MKNSLASAALSIIAKKDDLFCSSDEEADPKRNKVKYRRPALASRELFGNDASEDDSSSDDNDFLFAEESDDDTSPPNTGRILVEDSGDDDEDIHPIHGRRFVDESEDEGSNGLDAAHHFPTIAGCDSTAYDCGWLPVFQKKTGILFDPDGETEAEIFLRLLGGNATLHLMVTETNRYAQQYIESQGPENLTPKSYGARWYPTDDAEMKAFIAITLYMGIVKLPTYEMYWSTDPLFELRGFVRLCHETASFR